MGKRDVKRYARAISPIWVGRDVAGRRYIDIAGIGLHWKSSTRWPKLRIPNIALERIGALFLAVILVAGLVLQLNNGLNNMYVTAATATVDTYPDGDQGTPQWRTAGVLNSTPCTTQCDYVDDNKSVATATVDADYVRVLTTDAGNEMNDFTTTNPSFSGTVAAITTVTVTFRAKSVACNGTGGTPCDNVQTNIFIGGALQTAQSQTITATLATYTKTFTLSSPPTNADDLRIRFTRVAQGNGGSNKDEVWVSQYYATLGYYYTPDAPYINQQAYVWENDDATVDTSAQLASANTALTGVVKGQRLTMRTHLRNTGGAVLEDLALFYDRNDNIWTRVGAKQSPVTGSGSGCTGNTSWTCTKLDGNSKNVGQYSSLGFDQRGRFWVTTYDATATNPRVISPGVNSIQHSTGQCAPVGEFVCFNPSTTANQGLYTSIAFNPADYLPYFSAYLTAASGDLYIINETQGSGGGTCGGTWGAYNCVIVDNQASNNVGQYSSLLFDNANYPWISYYDSTAGALKVASKAGLGYSACTGSGWVCKAIDSVNTSGQYSSMALDGRGRPWIAHYDGGNLRVARFVSTGGSGCDGGVTDWSCFDVETTNDIGSYASLAFDAAGDPWISYYDATNGNLRVAYCVNAQTTNCDNTPSTEWTFTDVDTTNDVGQFTSMAFDAAGNPWIAYYEAAATSCNDTPTTECSLRVARYVGSSGSGCASSAWTCETVDNPTSTGDLGKHTSLAFDADGNPTIAYYDTANGDQYITKLIRKGEITISPSGVASVGSNTLTKSRADSTLSTADCISGSTTWNDGKWFEAAKGSGLSLAAGSGTPQCTEVAWTIDTTNALVGQTYRFIIATEDAYAKDKNRWRGPTTKTQYPTFTVEAASSIRYGKDLLPYGKSGASTGWADCNNSDWACTVVSSGALVGEFSSMDFDHEGVPWIAYNDGTNGDLYIARYVGSGGGNTCALSGGSYNNQWACTKIDGTSTNVGDYPSLAIAPDGSPWISYYDVGNTNLKVARYVGSGGTGCDSAAWTCETVDSGGTAPGLTSAIAFDSQGNAWINYERDTRIRIAFYVGGGGNCSSAAWTCYTILSGFTQTGPSAIAVDRDNNIIFTSGGSANTPMWGVYGTGNTANTRCSPLPHWCEVSNWSNTFLETTIAMDPSGFAWFPAVTPSATSLKYARFVASGGAGCNNFNWTTTLNACKTIDTVGGAYATIAMDADGNPHIAYEGSTSSVLRYAQYSGTGGTGCTGSTTAGEWSCGSIDTTSGVGDRPSIAFDLNGLPWISHHKATATNGLYVAKKKLPSGKPQITTANDYAWAARAAKQVFPRFRLDAGNATSDTGYSCGSATDKKGYCALVADDGQYDSLAASNGDEAPVYYLSTNYSTNAELPTATWRGQSNLAASTGNIKLQVYRYGSTNAWEDLVTNSSCSANTQCTLTGMPSGTVSDYFETDGSTYWVHFRVLQIPDNSTSITFKTDQFVAPQPTQQISGGALFRGEKRLPLNSR